MLTSNYSSIVANGGYGYYANGGAAYVGVLAGGINIVGDGGEGSVVAQGGDANYSEPGGNGGAAGLLLNTAGTVNLTNASVYALGGEAYLSGGNGGDATLGIVAGGGMNVLADGGEQTSIHAYGGNSNYNGNGGIGQLRLSTSGGNIIIDDDDVVARGGNSNDGNGGNAEARVQNSGSGQIIIQNGGYVQADGGEGAVTGGNAFVNLQANGSLSILNGNVNGVHANSFNGNSLVNVFAGGQILFQNFSAIYANSNQNATAIVTGLAGITLDTGGIFVDAGNNASALISTNGSLNVLNNSPVTVNGGNNGLVLIDTGGDVNVVGSNYYAPSIIQASHEVVMTVGGTVNLHSGDGGEAGGAIIAAESPDTIFINFRNISSRDGGGYFVNGQEGLIWDEATQTGFFADGAPAILGQNLFITYSGSDELPQQIKNALNSITDEVNKVLKKDKKDDKDQSDTKDDGKNDDKDKPTCS
jgi:hypothetical protein